MMTTFSKQYQITTLIRKSIAAMGMLAIAGTANAGDCINPDKINPDAGCTEEFEPVCGCNDVTYSNRCEAEAAGVTEVYAAACPNDMLKSLKLDVTECYAGETANIISEQFGDVKWFDYEVGFSDESIVKSATDAGFDGSVSFLKAGTAKITIGSIFSGIDPVSISVSVIDPAKAPMSSFFVDKTELLVGETAQIGWDLKCKCKIDWDDYWFSLTTPNVMKLVGNGKLEAIGKGDTKLTLTNSTTQEKAEFYFTVQKEVIDVPKLNALYLESNTIKLGETTKILAEGYDDIDWKEEFYLKVSDKVEIPEKGQLKGIEIGKPYVSVMHIETGAVRTFDLEVNYDLYSGGDIELKVGESTSFTLNPTYQDFFYIKLDKEENIEFDEETLTVKANAAKQGYAGILFYYKNTDQFETGIKIKITDTTTQGPEGTEVPEITSIKRLNDGKTLEITFDKTIELYDGIEDDFQVILNTLLKSSSIYEVSKVMAKTGSPNTLVLIMSDAVPVEGFTVQYKDSKTFAIATNKEIAEAVSANIYPNPASNRVTATAEGLIEAVLISMTGEVIVSLPASGNTVEMDITEAVAPGRYQVQLITTEGVTTQTLFIK